MFYCLAYFNGFLWIVALKVLGFVQEGRQSEEENVGTTGTPFLFTVQVFGKLLLPLQGLFNCLVYLMPSFRRWKQARPDLTIWVIVGKIIFLRETPLPSDHRHQATTKPATLAGQALAPVSATTTTTEKDEKVEVGESETEADASARSN